MSGVANVLLGQQLASDVKTCQSAGIKVLVSLGGWGSTPPGEAYGLESQSEAEKLADDLWNLFGGGSSNIFGGTKVDGVRCTRSSSNEA